MSDKTINRKSHYHSSVGRRDFMKMLGIGTGTVAMAGMGDNAFADFKDLDDMASSPYSKRNLPWWVKEVDEPTLRIDWELTNKHRHKGRSQSAFDRDAWTDKAEYDRIQREAAMFSKEATENGRPSYELHTLALDDAAAWGRKGAELIPPFEHPLAYGLDFSKPVVPGFPTPEQRGVPKWSGTPEEATHILRTAGRIMGAADIGVVEINEKTKGLLYDFVKFEDVEKGFTRSWDPRKCVGELVLPSKKQLYAIVSLIPQSLYLAQFGQHGDYMNYLGYTRRGYADGNIYINRLKIFLRGLGYAHYGLAFNGIGRNVAFGIMAGLGETSRSSILCSPQYGTNLRATMVTITDLPLAPTKPIDAGIVDFCKVCMKCADMCPTGAMSKDKEPSMNATNPHSAVGYEGWFLNPNVCYQAFNKGCCTCLINCPFTKFDTAVMHDLIKIAIAKAPMLGSAIHAMDDIFGYGMVPSQSKSIWDVDPMDVPLNGLDHSRS